MISRSLVVRIQYKKLDNPLSASLYLKSRAHVLCALPDPQATPDSLQLTIWDLIWMIRHSRINKPLMWLIISAGALSAAAGAYFVRTEYASAALLFIAGASILLSWITHVRLARSGIYFTLSEVLVFLWLVTFGTGIATLLAISEAVIAAYSYWRKENEVLWYNLAVAGSLAGIATVSTGLLVEYFFGVIPEAATMAGDTNLVLLLAVMVGSQFAIRSILLAMHSGAGETREVWKVWFERCLNGFALYVIGGLAAGMILRASHGRDLLLIVVGLLIGGVVFFTYRRYVHEIRQNLERAEAAEKGRAQEARSHVAALEDQIAKLETAEKELSRSEARFRRAAYHDPLTDLPNRRFLELELEKSAGRIRKTANYSFATLYLDLDRFGSINESLGREVADQFLIGIGERLTGLTRENDFLARASDDEFVILLSDVSNEGDALHFADLVRRKLSAPFNIDGKILFANATSGVVVCNSVAGCGDALRKAQIAMQEARSAEKPYLVFDEAMYRSAMNRLQIENDLHGALDRNEFEPYFQPIVDLETLETAGFEALVRWNHPNRGLVPPGEFIPVCEASGMIIPLTQWMIEEGCRTLTKWHQKGGNSSNIFMSVNLSAKDFAGKGLVEHVEHCLKASGIKPSCLKLEITESAIMTNSESAIKMLKELKDLGVMLSIDDFGTGYSSLSYLHRFPVDALKVDRSFVGSMEFGSENGEIVRTVITLAKLLGMKIISEGIETIHQLHQLKILKCEYGQGNLFSVPVRTPEAEAMLDDPNRWRRLDPNAKRISVPSPPLENLPDFHQSTGPVQ
ncbi:MAG: bifunctional diguanylate cyclase/phosphodiesterase [Acidobacteria bacterium]|nr:MAG: bifunctional diguanylate cyclase/phosphodiesterase [Acidobacteriota bacterium]REK02601.1 MAG: bifunctional diguanylate cyclase/phosphodiesterase [Acidobacteriota bacterium]REK13596.1 MAG: bifunctional diguanylate cyclase/phosphodiesterase [Acidobacteriota bacterium]REK41590.1 MAG: bifunctional diguanylate cyclase/phosphodiesterase [Acidobacteriota bacterium]